MTRTTFPPHPELAIPDDHGLYWSIPNYVVDWINGLILREVQGPDWNFEAILSSFGTLPGETTDLLRIFLCVENCGDALEITIQGGLWNAEAASHPLGKTSLYRSACKALIWLPGWRSIATGKMVRVLGLPEELEGPWLGDDWLIGDTPKVEIASRPVSV